MERDGAILPGLPLIMGGDTARGTAGVTIIPGIMIPGMDLHFMEWEWEWDMLFILAITPIIIITTEAMNTGNQVLITGGFHGDLITTW